MINIQRYRDQQAAGASAIDMYCTARQEGLDPIASIRLIRELFQLSLVEAKEVIVKATGLGDSLDTYQETLLQPLEQALTPSLQQNWRITIHQLEQARAVLHLSAEPELQHDHFTQYQNWLDQNELELALDELAEIGEQYAGGSAFWQALLVAAQTMNLIERAKRYQVKIDS